MEDKRNNAGLYVLIGLAINRGGCSGSGETNMTTERYRHPVNGHVETIGPHVLASEALNLMEKKKITSVVVTDEERRVLGVVHLHDLWTLELM